MTATDAPTPAEPLLRRLLVKTDRGWAVTDCNGQYLPLPQWMWEWCAKVMPNPERKTT